MQVRCVFSDWSCSVSTGIAEVMSLVTGLAAEPESSSKEVTAHTDPFRVTVSHTLQPDSQAISFSVELLSRMTADTKGLVLRCEVLSVSAAGRHTDQYKCFGASRLVLERLSVPSAVLVSTGGAQGSNTSFLTWWL